MTAWACVNGEIVEEGAARIAALDRGLLHGRGVFETMRSYHRRVFRLAQHLRRAAEGARALDIAVAIDVAEIEQAVNAILARNRLEDAQVRLTATAGPETDSPRPMVVITARPLGDQYPAELYERGMSVVVSGVRRNETSPLTRVKSLNYLDNVLAREWARQQGADEALLLNSREMVAEGSASNLFILDHGGLMTPPVDAGALPGITRAAVMEVAAEAGIDCRESNATLDELKTAKEGFLTGSIMGVMPLTRLEGAAIGSGRPGPVTGLMRRLYERLIERETGAR